MIEKMTNVCQYLFVPFSLRLYFGTRQQEKFLYICMYILYIYIVFIYNRNIYVISKFCLTLDLVSGRLSAASVSSSTTGMGIIRLLSIGRRIRHVSPPPSFDCSSNSCSHCSPLSLPSSPPEPSPLYSANDYEHTR